MANLDTSDVDKKNESEATDASSAESLDTATFTMTRDQYLVFLFDEMLAKDCDTTSMLQYIMLTLPGMSDDACITALEDGPKLSTSYVNQKEASLFAFSRLVQYRASTHYENIKKSADRWPAPEKGPSYYPRQRLYRHKEGDVVTVSKHPPLELR